MTAQALKKSQDSSGQSGTFTAVMLRMTLMLAINAFAIWFALRAFGEGFLPLGIVIALITAIVNYIILVNDMYPLRWMVAGLVMMLMFSIYPIILTVIVGFTNYGDGHLLTKQQSIEQTLKQRYLPEGGSAYSWTGYINEAKEYVLFLQDADGNGFVAFPGQALVPAADASDLGDLDNNGIPSGIGEFERLNAIQVASNQDITNIQFGTELDGVKIRSAREAAQLEQQFEYNEANDVLIDLETDTEYFPRSGTWTSNGGDSLTFGFQANVGFDNFTRFFTSSAFRGPLVRIIVWNFAFAFLSVFMTFALGLAIAYIFNDPTMPGRKLIQSLLLIPYTIPSLITILIWKGMFNNQVGVINRNLDMLFGISPAWTVDPWLAKAAILIVNLWLGYPYFMLICSGALQAIPADLYAAAEVDGANGWQRFSKITLPLLLVAVGPLLVASFTYNFNNFNLIFLFIEGGPPIAGAATRAGHTDILISYVYNLAFAAGRGKEYGLGAAITIVIFAIVAVITLLQFRFTQMWEEVGENV
ncbi:MAG: maltose ABC transporter permease MalF [Anaerolineae bacterium]